MRKVAIDRIVYAAHELLKTRDCIYHRQCPRPAGKHGVCDFHAQEIIRAAARRRGIWGDNHRPSSNGDSDEELSLPRQLGANESLISLILRARERLEAEARAEAEEYEQWVQREVAMPARGGEVTALIKEIRAAGYKVASGGKHKRVLDAKGRVVIDEHGPVIISATPGDANWLDMARARLRRAGVLKEKPGPTKRKGERGESEEKEKTLSRKERDDEQKKARRIERENDARARHQRTMAIRARIEPLVTLMGGWNIARGVATSGIVMHELGAVIELWSHRQGMPEEFASTEAAAESARILKTGGTMSDKRAKVWDGFVRDWESATDARAWYWERAREVRGLPPDWKVQMRLTQSTLPPVVEEPQVEETGVAAAVPTPAATPPAEPEGSAVDAPALPPAYERVLRAVFLMSRGATGIEEWDEILDYARKIYGKE